MRTEPGSSPTRYRCWNFYEIFCALNTLQGNRWKVRATEDFDQDQRMSDDRVQVRGLEERLDLKG